MRKILIIFGILHGLLGLVVLFVIRNDYPHFPAGTARGDVEKKMGVPKYVARWKADIPRKGFVIPDRPVTDLVLVYDKGSHWIFVYLDAQGCVEDVKFGGS